MSSHYVTLLKSCARLLAFIALDFIKFFVKFPKLPKQIKEKAKNVIKFKLFIQPYIIRVINEAIKTL
jgi:hypothetical protein